MRPPAPAYRGEGLHALWHVSEDPTIGRFEPHRADTSARDDLLVWAIDTRHLPLYWFPRQCPRGTWWASPETTEADEAALLSGARRVHAIQGDWLAQMREARVVAYRLPDASFEPDPETGGYWLSRDPVEPLEMVELGDLLALHAAAEIELRIVPDLAPLWQRVIQSSLEFSGMRLRKLAAGPPPPRGVGASDRAGSTLDRLETPSNGVLPAAGSSRLCSAADSDLGESE